MNFFYYYFDVNKKAFRKFISESFFNAKNKKIRNYNLLKKKKFDHI
jgi:hypothetical protein